ncbi:MAG: host-nuclease inhibitor Gam family protein [Arenicellales bacterium]
MARAATKIKTESVDAPNNRDDAENYMRQIGELQNQVQRTQADMNDEINAIKAKYQESMLPINQKIDTLAQGLSAWAIANRVDLLPGNKKTVKMGTGEISWRKTPPRVAVRGADTVIANLTSLGLGRFVRSKEEVNKEAILLDKEAVSGIKGISITQREELVIKPDVSELEKVEVIK